MEFERLMKKEQIGTTMKRYGALQILVGIGCSIMSFVAIGVDRGNFEELKKTGNYDWRNLILGLDISTLICSAMIVCTGVLPVYLFRNADFDLIKTKIIFMVASIMCASLFVPFIAGAQAATFVLRGTYKWIPAVVGVLSFGEFLIGIAASVHCCFSPWANCKLQPKCKNMEQGEYKIKIGGECVQAREKKSKLEADFVAPNMH